MVQTLKSTSTMERIHRELSAIINETVPDVKEAPELDFNSPLFRLPDGYQIPCFNITLQVMPEISKSLPVMTIRANIQVLGQRNSGNNLDEVDRKTMVARDNIKRIIQSRTSQRRLGSSAMIRINDTPPQQMGNFIMSVMQVEFKAFQRQGEY